MSVSPYTLDFPPELPVSQQRETIMAALEKHQVIVVAGATGSGKTTQLPKMALALGRKKIAHTQPRRIAARTIAERIAEETGTELGGLVGYQVRFTDQVSEATRITLMTDGILLAAIHRDRELKSYDTIIIDEAHERSLNIDFLLGYLKTLLPKRPDLKVIITSATIDPDSFATHFAAPDGTPAPVIEVSGRTYPVEIRYRPLLRENSDGSKATEIDMFDGLADAVAELSAEGPGDILAFFSGEAEIRDAADTLRGRFAGNQAKPLEVLPLYGRLSAAEQHRVFEPETRRPGARRIILATNVAETSLTVPGIRYVIDTGTARISRYSSRSKVQRLPIEPISQASANQRSGRAGRTSPGIAIRLYAEDDFAKRPEFTDPEILRTGLGSVILQMLALGLGNISGFPFLTPPEGRGVNDGINLLLELGAAKRHEKQLRITRLGREMARLPIEPRFARMVLEAKRLRVLPQVLAIVAGLTVQDVRERPADQRAEADQAHARFADPTGDLLTLLNLWEYLRSQQQELSASAFRRLCKAEFLNFLRVREWMDLVRQLARVAGGGREALSASVAGADPSLIHRAILAGLLSHLGIRDERTGSKPGQSGKHFQGKKQFTEFLGSRGTRFVLHPSSVLAKKPPQVVMSVELVETSRLFARQVATIEPEWAEELAPHLVSRQISEPRWDAAHGQAVASEKVLLYGVPIVAGRRVQLARFDSAHARELFIRHALVANEWYGGNPPHAFVRANQTLLAQLQREEEKARRRSGTDDEENLFAFYDARIPETVTGQQTFEKWWQKTRKHDAGLLHLNRADLREENAPSVSAADFPSTWQIGDQRLKLRYRFDPTAADDGVTVTVPLPLLPRLRDSDFAHLVPGLRHELVTALIRSLPKPLRRHVVPAADWATTLLHSIGSEVAKLGTAEAGENTLESLLAGEIRRRTSALVSPEDFDRSKLPNHLTPTFRVVDARGRTVGTGSSLAALQKKYGDRARQGVAAVANAGAREAGKPVLQRSNITTWDFGTELPRYVDADFAGGRGGAGKVRAYPALVDRGSHVDLLLVTSAAQQETLLRRGLRRLVALSSPSTASYVTEHLANNEKLLLAQAPYAGMADTIADITLALAEDAIYQVNPAGLIWQEADFNRACDIFARALVSDIFGVVETTVRVLADAKDAGKAVAGATSLAVLGQVSDAKQQLAALLPPQQGGKGEGFISRTGIKQLERLPVYLQAVTHRMTQLTENPGRDRVWQNEIEKATALYTEAGGTLPLALDAPSHIRHARWMLEELRISLFAQQLRTAESVSLQRIRKVLQEG